jgi:NAD(P)H-hydrate epimerase
MVRGVTGAEQLAPLLARATVVAIGPGLGQEAWGRALLGAVLASELPLVLDADALNLLAQGLYKWPQDALITPHPAEAARILGTTTAQVQRDRFAAVRALAERTGAVAVLKGAGSLVAAGGQTFVCGDGNPGMAVGGMGDVLSGVAGALRAQGLAAAAAAVHAVCLHARAGDVVARKGERGMLPSDVVGALSGILNGVA